MLLHEEIKQDSSSSYSSCQNTASPPSMSSTFCAKEQEQSTQGVHEVESVDHDKSTETKDEVNPSRSIMASRWACESPTTTHQEKPEKATTVPPTGPKDWFKKRDDLFNGSATVNNASKELFNNTPRRTENKPKEVKKGPSQQPKIPVLSPSTADNMLRPHQQPSKSAQLTGSNLLAAGGDNGWTDRSQRAIQVDKFTASEGILRRDLPPHMTSSSNNRMQDPRFDAPKENAFSNVNKNVMPQQEERKYGDHNERLLESIARMEQRNYGMLSSRPASNSNLNPSLHGINTAGFDDSIRGGYLASGW